MSVDLNSIESTECWFEDDMLIVVINFEDGGYYEQTFEWHSIDNYWSYVGAGR
tara:strand:- start:1239 stop:1397 length:159 start_codon:yes stop_codon:yes gene_type:complete